MRLHENKELFADAIQAASRGILSDTWETLQETYNKEMPDLAYQSIPTVGQIQASIRTILGII